MEHTDTQAGRDAFNALPQDAQRALLGVCLVRLLKQTHAHADELANTNARVREIEKALPESYKSMAFVIYEEAVGSEASFRMIEAAAKRTHQ